MDTGKLRPLPAGFPKPATKAGCVVQTQHAGLRGRSGPPRSKSLGENGLRLRTRPGDRGRRAICTRVCQLRRMWRRFSSRVRTVRLFIALVFLLPLAAGPAEKTGPSVGPRRQAAAAARPVAASVEAVDAGFLDGFSAVHPLVVALLQLFISLFALLAFPRPRPQDTTASAHPGPVRRPS